MFDERLEKFRRDYEEMRVKIQQESVQLPQNQNDKPIKKRGKSEEDLFDEIAGISERLVEKRGIIFDSDCVLWAYDKKAFCYKHIDENDVYNIIDEECGIFDALKPMYRQAYFNAIKIYGRKKADLIVDPTGEKNKYSVQFNEMIFDCKTMMIKKTSPEHFVFNSIPWTPKEVSTPTIDSLFASWIKGGNPAELKDIIAYSCLPHNTQKYIFFYFGQTSSGKSQYLGVMQKFLGARNCTTSDFAILSSNNQRFEKITLRNKLAVFMSEIDGKKIYNTSCLKTLSGNDHIRGEYKGGNNVSFRFGGKAHIATNSLPTIEDDEDDAFFGRTVIKEFPNKYENGSVEIMDTIPDTEFEGLAHYCFFRIQEWAKNGISLIGVGSREERSRNYREKTDLMKHFIAMCCEIDEHGDFGVDTEYRISSYLFCSNFNGWIQKRGHQEWTREKIGREINRVLGKRIQKAKRTVNTNESHWEYRGIRSKEEQQKLPNSSNFQAFPGFHDVSLGSHAYIDPNQSTWKPGNAWKCNTENPRSLKVLSDLANYVLQKVSIDAFKQDFPKQLAVDFFDTYLSEGLNRLDYYLTQGYIVESKAGWLRIFR